MLLRSGWLVWRRLGRAVSFSLADHDLPVLLDARSGAASTKALGNFRPLPLADFLDERSKPGFLVDGPAMHDVGDGNALVVLL